ncbi:MAG: nucleotidyltransferase [Gammaproteobacteria bacterium]
MRARRAGQSPLLLLDVIEVLDREGVDYAVIGALAAAVYGAIRASADADALVSLTVSKLSSLSKIFKKKGFAVELRRGDANDPIPAMLVVGDKHQNRVDLLGGLRGLDPQTLSRTVEIPFSGATMRVVGREDFIAMKCFAGGPRDLEDARVALRTADRLDLDLLRKVTRRFGRPAADALELLLA